MSDLRYVIIAAIAIEAGFVTAHVVTVAIRFWRSRKAFDGEEVEL